MTYIATINRCGSTAIFADSMLTIGDEKDIKSIKNGILLPGIIYGVSGDFDEAMRFVCRCQFEAGVGQSIEDNWQAIEKVADRIFTAVPGRDFQVSLSTRHTGRIEHYVMDSRCSGVHPAPKDKLVSMGCGKRLFDPYIFGLINTRLSESGIEQLNNSFDRFSLSDWPFLLCFFLHQRVFGASQYELEKMGVGGLCHFVRQTDSGEERQGTAMYIIAGKLPGAPDPSLTKYRYTFEGDDLLFYEKPFGGKGLWALLLMNFTDQDVAVNPDDDKRKFDLLIEKHKAAPPYHVLVAGMWDPDGKPMIPFVDVFDGEHIDADLEDYLDPNLNSLLMNLSHDKLGDWLDEVRSKVKGPTVRLRPTKARKKWPS